MIGIRPAIAASSSTSRASAGATESLLLLLQCRTWTRSTHQVRNAAASMPQFRCVSWRQPLRLYLLYVVQIEMILKREKKPIHLLDGLQPQYFPATAVGPSFALKPGVRRGKLKLDIPTLIANPRLRAIKVRSVIPLSLWLWLWLYFHGWHRGEFFKQACSACTARATIFFCPFEAEVRACGDAFLPGRCSLGLPPYLRFS